MTNCQKILKCISSLRLGQVKPKSLAMCCLASLFMLACIYGSINLLNKPMALHSADLYQQSSRASGEFQRPKKGKRILFWTNFYSYESRLESYCVSGNSLANCAHTNCEFTTDRRFLNSSDAIVFHGRNLLNADGTYIELPRYRSSNQIWIFLMFESPVHTWTNLGPFDSNVFNMTMTYRPDSDVYIPYGRLVPINGTDLHPNDNQQQQGPNSTEKRLVAWAVSNCFSTPSQRGKKVDELRKYISVDIYGACGSLKCTQYTSVCDSGLECHQYSASKYKFYLAFENSLCQDYITEKFYHSLHVGMVPIVYGYGNYSRLAPKGSYIDFADFPTVKSLADHLLHLDRTPSEYEKYFEWRKHFRVQVSYFDLAWCSLCTKLWADGPNEVHQVSNLSSWWFYKSSSRHESSKEPSCFNVT